MAVDFDNFPVYDILVKRNVYMSDVWSDFFATFVQTLQGYLSQNGMFVPQVTTSQRNSLKNVINGQLIYNTTLNKFQGYENGSWQNLI